MKIKYYSHASFQLVAKSGKKLLTDPWLFNPIYGNTLWQFPECPVPLDEYVQQDALYISHDHPDHWCARTLDLFSKSIPVIIRRYGPQVPIRRSLERLGFERIIELEHRESTEPFAGLRVTLFADHTSSDSLIIATDGVHSVLDQNDCLLPPEEYDQIGRDFDIDLGILFYSGGSIFPARFAMDGRAKLEAAQKRISSQYEYSVDTARRLRVKAMIPGANDLCMFRTSEYDPYVSALPIEFKQYAQTHGATYDILTIMPGEIYDCARPGQNFSNHFKDRSEWSESAACLRRRPDVVEIRQRLEIWEASFCFDSIDFFRKFSSYCTVATRQKTTISDIELGLQVGLRIKTDDEQLHEYIIDYFPHRKVVLPSRTLDPEKLHMVITLDGNLAGMCMSGAAVWEDMLNCRWYIERPNASYKADEYSFWEFISNFSGYLDQIGAQPRANERFSMKADLMSRGHDTMDPQQMHSRKLRRSI